MRKGVFILFTIILFGPGVYAIEVFKNIKDSISGEYTGDFFTNVSGGIKTGSGYLGKADLNFQLDFSEKSTLFFKGAMTHGATPSESYIGDSQTASNIEAGNHSYVQELWFRQKINKFEWTVGLQDLNKYFMAGDNAGDFLNSSFGIPPVTSEHFVFPIFPLTGLSISGKWNITDVYSWNTAIYDGYQTPFEHNPHNLKWNVNADEGFLFISELQVMKENRSYKAGGYYHIGAKDAEPEFKRNFGAYFIGDFSVNETWNLFSQVVLSSKSSKTFDPYLGLGATFSYDEKSSFGAAVAHAGTYEKSYKQETTIECFYKRTLSDNIEIQPDIQYIINPSGNTDGGLKNALVGFVRLKINI
ncbi:MAG: carbohydrate porin [Candidatus Symbiothrix sp.]|jgi:porin|nr:carbohydrate porin [Candidatus Symbiothrix sp.]